MDLFERKIKWNKTHFVIIWAICWFFHRCVFLLITNLYTHNGIHVEAGQLTCFDYGNTHLKVLRFQMLLEPGYGSHSIAHNEKFDKWNACHTKIKGKSHESMIFLYYRLLLLSVNSSSSSPSLESYDGVCEMLSLRSFCESCADVKPPPSKSLISDLFANRLSTINLICFYTINHGCKLIRWINGNVLSDDGLKSICSRILSWIIANCVFFVVFGFDISARCWIQLNLTCFHLRCCYHVGLTVVCFSPASWIAALLASSPFSRWCCVPC